MTDVTETALATRRRTPAWLAVTIAVLFGLFYAYDVWEAVGNLVGLLSTVQSLDTQFSAFGWVVLIGAIIVPVVLFAGAFWLGRARAPLGQVLLYGVGLCASAALSLDVFVMGLGRLLV
ncbi:hypothetical protein [Cryobacterium roopkundense]|uniref:Uncharacterized protein n=1 Tax=Cryobacterium roopkundense TaxID=1001240 RepID=A0A7W8ZWY3_9MICO|nr:hypothetical protein [Cryobacterium roopkundense]MBB5641726.1 hypothetical protein [Cryobacterium roopkundense]